MGLGYHHQHRYQSELLVYSGSQFHEPISQFQTRLRGKRSLAPAPRLSGLRPPRQHWPCPKLGGRWSFGGTERPRGKFWESSSYFVLWLGGGGWGGGDDCLMNFFSLERGNREIVYLTELGLSVE